MLAYLATLWDKSRAVLTKMMAWLIVPQRLQDESLKAGVRIYLRTHAKRRYSGIKTFAVYWGYLRKTAAWRYFAFEMLQDSTLVWINFRPVWYSAKQNAKRDGASDESHMIRFIRWTFPKYHFVNKAVEILNKEEERKESAKKLVEREFYVDYVVGDINSKGGKGETQPLEAAAFSGGVDIYMKSNFPIGFDWEDIGQNEGDKAFEDFVTTKAQDQVLKEIEFWLSSKDWYEEKSIPWHRGYVLHGIQGSGKSSFVRAVGQKFDIPIFVFDLASMDNHDFVEFWKQKCRLHKKRIILIEDIDGIFDKRKNVASTGHNQGLTFDCLLNCIDGVDRYDGTLLFISTNKIETLDPALGGIPNGEMESRPGRVDRVVELGYMDALGKVKLIERICGDFMRASEVADLANKYMQITPASLQEICFRLALENKWQASRTSGVLQQQNSLVEAEDLRAIR